MNPPHEPRQGPAMMDNQNATDSRAALDHERRRLLRAAGALPVAAGLAVGGPGGSGSMSVAQAQEVWPSRPMRCVVAFAAGGVLDITTRVVTEQMASQLGQPIVVENRGGASGNIGTDWVLRAPADGYTWMACSPYLVTNPLLTPNTKWKTTDFAGIGLIGAPPNVFVVPTALPVRTMRELVDHVKARPGALNVSNPSFGSSNHLGQELLFSQTGMEMQNILYKTQAEMLPGIINGEVAMGLCTIALALPHIKDGKLRALAISAPRRSQELPEVPTIGEAGYPDAMFLPWFGMVAAAGTPRPVLQRLSVEMQKALAAPQVVTRLEKMGAQLTPASGEEFDKLIASETRRWSEVVRKRNIRPVG